MHSPLCDFDTCQAAYGQCIPSTPIATRTFGSRCLRHVPWSIAVCPYNTWRTAFTYNIKQAEWYDLCVNSKNDLQVKKRKPTLCLTQKFVQPLGEPRENAQLVLQPEEASEQQRTLFTYHEESRRLVHSSGMRVHIEAGYPTSGSHLVLVDGNRDGDHFEFVDSSGQFCRPDFGEICRY